MIVMDMLTIFFIAIGLAMDAFAISIVSGFSIKKLKKENAFKIALFFGIFQGIMPIIGWFIGFGFRDFVLGIGHWIAFALLAAIGIKMIYESTKIKTNKQNPLKNSVLLILAIATSIDAFVVGASLSILNTPIITPAILTGIITFVLSFIGVYIGKKIGHFFENKIEALGGLILILIGLKILLENIMIL